MREEHPIEAIDLRLLSNFVHQVINPLNGVIGTLDNIIDGTVARERRDQRLRAVRAQLEWAVLLVRNLAYFADVASAPGRAKDLQPTKTCILPQLIIEAALFFQEPGLSRGIEIHLEDRTTQYAVTGSPDLLRQVFMNLFDNAVKYAREESRVLVKIWPQKKTGNLLLEFTNQGIGFPVGEAEKLFELGFRGEEAKGLVASGTGLGLYICKLILSDVHSAEIEAVHSRVKGVTTIRIRFPNWRVN